MLALDFLSVRGLEKHYPAFSLKQISFSLEAGYILGFIGRNGAGKTTTLKSILGFVRPDAGEVEILGRNIRSEEDFCKKNIGVIFGEFPYYSTKKLSTVTAVTRRFYSKWDEAHYRRLLNEFDLDESKKIAQLSAGMKVKYALALALSHNARLLILDEPTSGLDPVSRDELMQIFRNLISDGEHSILFSTHILSDLDQCADYILYIRNGEITEYRDTLSLKEAYRLVSGTKQMLAEVSPALVAWKENAFGFTGLIEAGKLSQYPGLASAPASVEDIMIYREKEVFA